MRNSKDGYVLVCAILLIAIAGLIMYVLSGLSSTMLNETISAQLDANLRNTIESAKIWAAHNAEKLSQEEAETTIQLDTDSFPIHKADCTITIKEITDGRLTVQIVVACSRKRQIKRKAILHTIELDNTAPEGPVQSAL